MNTPNSKELIDSLITDLLKQYTGNCSFKEVVYYLIENGVIEPTHVRNMAIVQDYFKHVYHDTMTITDWSAMREDYFGLKETRIKGIVYKYIPKTMRKANVKG
jgi:hypothetical protein